jgi:predicted lipoprotein with Yx(FWY)xxD motif
MQRPSASTGQRSAIGLTLLAVVLVALVAAGNAIAAGKTKQVAAQGQVQTLGTVLTNTKHRTLYSLSAETKGRFICTASCLSTWHPLLTPAGVKPKGPVKLGTIERPEGKTQVTYKGLPLYTFSGDSKAGEANGEGIKDVGTWHAAVLAKPAAPQPQPQPEPSYPY